jgi:hypothetical protein
MKAMTAQSQTEIDERRFRRVQMAPELLVDWCKTRSEPLRAVTCNGLPQDAEFVRGAVLQTACGNAELHLIVRSSEFEPVPRGAVIPLICPCYTECVHDGSNEDSPKAES